MKLLLSVVTVKVSTKTLNKMKFKVSTLAILVLVFLTHVSIESRLETYETPDYRNK